MPSLPSAPWAGQLPTEPAPWTLPLPPDIFSRGSPLPSGGAMHASGSIAIQPSHPIWMVSPDFAFPFVSCFACFYFLFLFVIMTFDCVKKIKIKNAFVPRFVCAFVCFDWERVFVCQCIQETCLHALRQTQPTLQQNGTLAALQTELLSPPLIHQMTSGASLLHSRPRRPTH